MDALGSELAGRRYSFKLMNFVFKMMVLVFKMMIFVSMMMNFVAGTSAQGLLPSLFQGVYRNQIIVDPCDALPEGYTRDLTDEVFTDVFVQVQGAPTLEVALRAKVTFDELSGSNQVRFKMYSKTKTFSIETNDDL